MSTSALQMKKLKISMKTNSDNLKCEGEEIKNFPPHQAEKRLFTRLTGIYLLWIIPAILIFHLPAIYPSSEKFLNVTVLLMIPVFMTLGMYIAIRIIHFDQTWITDLRKPRALFLCMTFVIWAILFYAERHGYMSNGLAGILGTANMLVASGFLGKGMSVAIKRPAEMIPVCMVAASADIFSILMGPTKKIADTIKTFYESGMTGPTPLADFFLIKIPIPGLTSLVPVFGVTDWILLIFISSSILKLDLNDNITGKALTQLNLRKRFFFYFPISAAGLYTGVFLAHITGLFIPGMPVMVLFLLPYLLFKYPDARKMTKSDILLTLGFPCMIFIAITLFFR